MASSFRQHGQRLPAQARRFSSSSSSPRPSSWHQHQYNVRANYADYTHKQKSRSKPAASTVTLPPLAAISRQTPSSRLPALNRNAPCQPLRRAPSTRSLSSTIRPRGQAVQTNGGWKLPQVKMSEIDVDGSSYRVSPLLLRDLCPCDRCIDSSTNQKHFSTADIPADIQFDTIRSTRDGIEVRWNGDMSGYGPEHRTHLSNDLLRHLVAKGQPKPVEHKLVENKRVYWDSHMFDQLPDIDFNAYMSDDATLLRAVRQLQSHGLLFVTNVPEDVESVARLANRIGPLKNTFYGETWDVRSTPQAINVAYTAQNLGFHMDLMYMEQPPFVQLLHCIRASSAGGASLFTDSYKAAADLARDDLAAFDVLSEYPIDFHYDHAGSQYYHQTRRVIERKSSAKQSPAGPADLLGKTPVDVMESVEQISWAPPFQAPFGLQVRSRSLSNAGSDPTSASEALSEQLQNWHVAAQKFNHLIHRDADMYERMMKPGECVLFDNRRVLHARRGFEVGDIGKERWLRGAYIDKDPFLSKLKILSSQAA